MANHSRLSSTSVRTALDPALDRTETGRALGRRMGQKRKMRRHDAFLFMLAKSSLFHSRIYMGNSLLTAAIYDNAVSNSSQIVQLSTNDPERTVSTWTSGLFWPVFYAQYPVVSPPFPVVPRSTTYTCYIVVDRGQAGYSNYNLDIIIQSSRIYASMATAGDSAVAFLY